MLETNRKWEEERESISSTLLMQLLNVGLLLNFQTTLKYLVLSDQLECPKYIFHFPPSMTHSRIFVKKNK